MVRDDVVGEGVEGKSYSGMAARACDSCKGSPALLFCRADSAFLCGECDAKVHGGNRFASRHERVRMCEVCEQAPAAVTCKADAATLCATCDAYIHSANALSNRHERFPVVPFYESPPAATAALNSRKGQDILRLRPCDDVEDDDSGGNEPDEADGTPWLLSNPNPNNDHQKGSMKPPELKAADFFFSDPHLGLDYASSMDARYEQANSIVPVQVKAVSAAAHPLALFSQDGCLDFHVGRPRPTYGNYTTVPSLSHNISSEDEGVVPEPSAMADVTNPYGRGGGTAAAASQYREARLMRYREKRKNRKFEKTIRYASRKAYAETRPRIKGRFAKRTEVEAERMFAATTLMVDPEYGVVPSFF